MEEAAKLFDMKVLHVGINATGEEQALGWAEEFLKVLRSANQERQQLRIRRYSR